MDGAENNEQASEKPAVKPRKKVAGIVALASVLALALGGIITLAVNNNGSISADVASMGSGALSSAVRTITSVPTTTFTPGQTITRPAYTQTSTSQPSATQTTSRLQLCQEACARQGKTCNGSDFTCFSGSSTPTPVVSTTSDVYDQVSQCQSQSYPATATHDGKECTWHYVNQSSPVGGYCACQHVDGNGVGIDSTWTAGVSTSPSASKTATAVVKVTPTPSATSTSVDDAKIAKCNAYSFDATSTHNGKLCQWTYDNKTMTSGYCVCHWVDSNGEFIGGDNGWIAQTNVATGVKGAIIGAYQSVANFFASVWARLF